MRAVLIITILMSLLITHKAVAQADIPPVLQEWKSWVLHDHPQTECPVFYNELRHECVWPTRLELDIHRSGGQFSYQVEVLAPAWITLPGSDAHWPQKVTANQQAQMIATREGEPAVRLQSGRYEIRGEWQWAAPPQTLGIPALTGLLKLTRDGQRVEQPSLANATTLLLAREMAETAPSVAERDQVSLSVFRKLTDTIPLEMETHIQLIVSGRERELQTGPVVLPGFRLVELNSPLPARIEADGQLRVQLQPGRWTIQLLANHSTDLREFAVTPQGADWPAQEIWAVETQPALRTIQVEGASLIDASQTQLPEAWRHLPAYLVTPDSRLTFDVTHRGDPNPAANQLSLTKEMWLDFGGGGATIKDSIQGRLQNHWRLDVHPAYRLGRVELAGKPQLITQLEDKDTAGVEIRTQDVQLSAVSRVDQVHDLPVSGWQETFESVRQTVYLPPGWSAFHVSGADNVGGTWLSGWNLWDIFLVLIITVALARVINPACGALALVTLLFTYQRDQAPLMSWLAILTVLALLPHVKGQWGRALQAVGVLCFVVLLLVLLPFGVQQARQVIYPQLEQSAQYSTPYLERPTPAAAQMAPMADTAQGASLKAMPETRASSRAAREKMTYNMPDYDPKQKVQVGPGLPMWQWQHAWGHWSGPVQAEETSGWILIPPLWNRFGDLLGLLLPCGLALWLGRRFWSLARVETGRTPGGAAAIAMLLVVVHGGFGSDRAHADVMVDGALLEDLRQRLLEPVKCLPSCAGIEAVHIEARDNQLEIRMRIHALEDVAVPIPSRIQDWQPESVTIQKVHPPLLRNGDEQLWVSLKRGIQEVTLTGRLGDKNSLDLDFAMPVHNVTYSLDGWRLNGLPSERQSSQILQLVRQATVARQRQTNQLLPDPIPAYVTVTRRIQLGLEWTVHTEVQRVAPHSGVIQLAIPLLDGEAPNSGQLTDDGKMDIRLAAGQQRASWESILSVQPAINLTAPQTEQWHEVWNLVTGPMWHSTVSGIPPVLRAGEQFNYLWQPWPGESVTAEISRPEPVAGADLALDKVELNQTFGKRATDHHLELTLRATYGGQFYLPLPEGAEPKRLVVDGEELPLTYSQQKLQIPVRPGEHTVRLEWQTPDSMEWMTRTPPLNLNQPATNLHLNMNLPQNRWTLLVGGPLLGPAVLFWGVFAVVVLGCLALGRSRVTPLKSYEWLLLSLGVATINVYVLILIVAWFITMQYRGKLKQPLLPSQFALMQILLIGFSVVTLLAMVGSIPYSLLASPEMYITGNHSSAHTLRWYHDQTQGPLPTAWVISVPLWVYRITMLLWSLWLAFALMRWIRWAWLQLGVHGYWRRNEKPSEPQA